MCTAYKEDEQAVSIVKLCGGQNFHQVLMFTICGDKPGTAEIEDIADSVTEDSGTVASHTIRLRIFHVPERHNGVIIRKIADVGTNVLAGHAVERYTSGLECLVNTLEQFPLLRVHGHGLSLRDPKERWIKLVLLGDKVTALETQCSNLGLLRIETVDIVPVGGRLRVSRSLVNKHLPKVVRGIRLAGEPTGLHEMLVFVPRSRCASNYVPIPTMAIGSGPLFSAERSLGGLGLLELELEALLTAPRNGAIADDIQRVVVKMGD